MAFVNLSCATIGSIAGGAAELIVNAAIAEAVTDLDDRAAEDGKIRRVVIELTLERRRDGQVETSVAAQAKLPPRKTASTVAAAHRTKNSRDTQLGFQVYAPEDPHQATLASLDDASKE